MLTEILHALNIFKGIKPAVPDSDGEAVHSGRTNWKLSQRLWDEYKLAQEKIDKIGEFQFKVKSWSVALLGALLFGGAATSQIPAALTGALLIAGSFHILEIRQRWLSRRLGRRAFAIERIFRYMLDTSSHLSEETIARFGPAIARGMTDESQDVTSNRKLRQLIDWFVRRSNDVFYWSQYALLVTLLSVHLFSSHYRKLGWNGDPNPRYEFRVGPYRLIIYRN
jgi:hypothetical protein